MLTGVGRSSEAKGKEIDGGVTVLPGTDRVAESQDRTLELPLGLSFSWDEADFWAMRMLWLVHV